MKLIVVNSNSTSFLKWLALSLLTTLLLSLAFAYAPLGFKKLILLYGVYGIVCGAVMGWLAAELTLTSRQGPLWISGVLVLLGGINLGWTSFQQFEATRVAQWKREPQQLAILTMLENSAKDDPELFARYQAERQKMQPAFSDYLRFRVSPLGNWIWPWPLVFWLCELVLACGLTVWFVKKSLYTERPGNRGMAPEAETVDEKES